MINILGIRRVVGILTLIALNLLVAGTMYLFFLPAKQKMEREMRITRATIAADRATADQLRENFQFYLEQKSLYAELRNLGFFADQDRFRAPERLESIKKISNLIRAQYEIGLAEKKDNKYAEKAGHVLLSTPIRIYDIEAVADTDIYNFIYWVENAFTGQTSITNIKMERAYDLNEAVIRQIGGGVATTLVTGSVSFEWRTMIPQEQYEQGMQSGAGTGTGGMWP